MRSILIRSISMAALLCCVLSVSTFAQDSWGSYSRAVSTRGYEGKKFKLEADVKATLQDDSASARLWARVDKEKGSAFFSNMAKEPIRSNAWKKYSIEGKIDEAATRLYFGALTELNGKFYYDNIRLSVETAPGKWETVYSTDFEKDLAGWSPGIGFDQNGINRLYKTSLATEAASNSKVLVIEGTEIPNFGSNKKAGKYADVNGIKLYYEIYGQGHPWSYCMAMAVLFKVPAAIWENSSKSTRS